MRLISIIAFCLVFNAEINQGWQGWVNSTWDVITIIETKKLHNIAIDPNPSGEIPNHHSDDGGIGPSHPNLNLAI